MSAARRGAIALLLAVAVAFGIREAEAYGRQAIVRMAGDTLFLSLFTAGWKVVAAGCTPRPGRPYDCLIKGA
ncbi:hypothetical protein DEJ50_04825 [Streptomyces venezuelae]|uniref:Uncharacterized protein n=1 Tax=Streptomyces venezuelae TaxID=54571 RepID=A0A5P2CWH2_STRVZ|nr:hypothetical protein [Streptomyces venezuelae]QES47254.1 hypothetical protein DEJ50_04825 [Streptomyces venezuelae]